MKASEMPDWLVTMASMESTMNSAQTATRAVEIKRRRMAVVMDVCGLSSSDSSSCADLKVSGLAWEMSSPPMVLDIGVVRARLPMEIGIMGGAVPGGRVLRPAGRVLARWIWPWYSFSSDVPAAATATGLMGDDVKTLVTGRSGLSENGLGRGEEVCASMFEDKAKSTLLPLNGQSAGADSPFSAQLALLDMVFL